MPALLAQLKPAEVDRFTGAVRGALEGVRVSAVPFSDLLGHPRHQYDEWLYPDETIELLRVLPAGSRARIVARAGEGILEAARGRVEAGSEPTAPERDFQTPWGRRAVAQAGLEARDVERFFETPWLMRTLSEGFREFGHQALRDLGVPARFLLDLGPFVDEHPDPAGFCRDLAEVAVLTGDESFLRAALDVSGDRIAPAARRSIEDRLAGPSRVDELEARAVWGGLVGSGLRGQARRRNQTEPTGEPSADEVAERMFTELGFDPRLMGAHPDDEMGDWVVRVGTLAILTGFGAQLPAEVLVALIDETFDPRFIEGYCATLAAIEAGEAPQTAARVQVIAGALLRAALRYAFENDQSLIDAWRSFPTPVVVQAELTAIVDYVETLPLEPRRNQWVSSLFGEHRDLAEPAPRLQGLRLIADRLPPESVERVLTGVIAIPDSDIRSQALGLVAPKLEREQLSLALESASTTSDFLERSWILGLLTPEHEPLRLNVMRWRAEAALHISQGTRMGQELSALVKDSGEAEAELLRAARDALAVSEENRRLDGLIYLLALREREAPREFVDLVLALPTVNATGKYSPRGLALLHLSAALPEQAIPPAWRAAQDLPDRVRIGDSESIGFDWQFEFVRAAAIEALVPRLPSHLLGAALEATRSFPWTPRRAVLTALTARADSDLGAFILELVLERAESYATLPPDTASPFLVDDIWVHEPVELFKVRREVDCAELIAALAPKLEERSIMTAAEHIEKFSNDGPRAWLPGQLAPYLPESIKADILIPATVAALGFIVTDPTRMDLLTDLLPHVRKLIDTQAEPMRRIVHKYFPGRRSLLLSPDEVASLDADDRAQYERYFDEYSQDLSARPAQEPLSDSDARRFLQQKIWNPLFSGEIDRVVAEVMDHSPLDKLLEGMPALSDFFPTAAFHEVVSRTLDRVLNEPMAQDEIGGAIAELAPFLSPDEQKRAAKFALTLPAPAEEELDGSLFERIAMHSALAEADGVYTAEPRSAGISWRDAQLDEGATTDQLKALAGPRSRLIMRLAPYLTADLLHEVVDAALTFPEREQVHTIPALMPHVAEPGRTALYERALSLPLGFARAWVLWQITDELTRVERAAALTPGLEAADAMSGLSHTMALLTLSGLADGDQRTEMRRRAARSIRDLQSGREALAAVATLVIATTDVEAIETAMRAVLELPRGVERTQTLSLLARKHPNLQQLAPDIRTRLRGFCGDEMRRASTSGRPPYLEWLANAFPIVSLWLDEAAKHEVARDVHSVCTAWSWV